jgi:hypothetical protein
VTWPRRLASAAASLGLAVVGLLAGAGPAAATAEPIGDCTTTSGVILAVDFAYWGGPLLRACGTTPTTGYQLLNEGGWSTQGDTHDGPTFICRIAYAGYQGGTAYPTPSQDPCIVTPPASAYWSYWHADPGQNTWSYSQLGAVSYKPEPGSVDLWTFGATNIAGTTGSGVPAFSPNTVRALNTQPVGSAAPSAAASTGAAGQAGNGGGGDNGGNSGRSSASAGGATPAPSHPGGELGHATVPPSSGSASVAPGSGAPRILNVAPTTTPRAAHSSYGSAVPALATLVAVLVLGGAGIAMALRRPRSHG